MCPEPTVQLQERAGSSCVPAHLRQPSSLAELQRRCQVQSETRSSLSTVTFEQEHARLVGCYCSHTQNEPITFPHDGRTDRTLLSGT